MNLLLFKNIVFKDFIYLFLDWGREGEREGKKHQCVVASCAPPTRDLAHNPGTCPDWELNQQPFGLQSSVQSTEPHQLGLSSHLLYFHFLLWFPELPLQNSIQTTTSFQQPSNLGFCALPLCWHRIPVICGQTLGTLPCNCPFTHLHDGL